MSSEEDDFLVHGREFVREVYRYETFEALDVTLYSVFTPEDMLPARYIEVMRRFNIVFRHFGRPRFIVDEQEIKMRLLRSVHIGYQVVYVIYHNIFEETAESMANALVAQDTFLNRRYWRYNNE